MGLDQKCRVQRAAPHTRQRHPVAKFIFQILWGLIFLDIQDSHPKVQDANESNKNMLCNQIGRGKTPATWTEIKRESVSLCQFVFFEIIVLKIYIHQHVRHFQESFQSMFLVLHFYIDVFSYPPNCILFEIKSDMASSHFFLNHPLLFWGWGSISGVPLLVMEAYLFCLCDAGSATSVYGLLASPAYVAHARVFSVKMGILVAILRKTLKGMLILL